MKRKLCKVGLVALVAVMIPARDAYAYIDPGTGSQILQIVVGALLAGLFALKTWWANLKAFFSSRSRTRRSDDKTDTPA